MGDRLAVAPARADESVAFSGSSSGAAEPGRAPARLPGRRALVGTTSRWGSDHKSASDNATAFPRVGHLLLWPTRLGSRGLLVYVAVDTLFRFAVMHYLLPHAKRIAEERDQLKNKLGREPTDDELAEHFGYGSNR